MTPEELQQKIDALTEAATNLGEPDKTFKLAEVRRLKIALEGMALQQLRAKLDAIQLPDIGKMDAEIAAAKDATKAHQARVEAFNVAFNLLKTALKVVI